MYQLREAIVLCERLHLPDPFSVLVKKPKILTNEDSFVNNKLSTFIETARSYPECSVNCFLPANGNNFKNNCVRDCTDETNLGNFQTYFLKSEMKHVIGNDGNATENKNLHSKINGTLAKDNEDPLSLSSDTPYACEDACQTAYSKCKEAKLRNTIYCSSSIQNEVLIKEARKNPKMSESHHVPETASHFIEELPMNSQTKTISRTLSQLSTIHDREIEHGEINTLRENSSSHTMKSGKAKVVDKRLFKYRECGFSYSKRSGLYQHFQGDFFQCECCPKSFLYKHLYLRHLKIHNEGRQFTCNDCGKMYFLKASLLQHLKCMHLMEKTFECENCGMNFFNKSRLSYHIQSHTRIRAFKCNDCGKSFTNKTNLSKHSVVHTKERRFHCETCGGSFTEKGSLIRHKVLHSGKKSFRCNECGWSFAARGNLQTHIKNKHTNKQYYPCGECGKLLAGKFGLKAHLKTHSREKTYSCGECGKKFLLRESLVNHIKRHLREEIFICNDCGKVFNEKGHLAVHTRVHTKHRPYKCRFCPRNFTQSSSARGHERRTHIAERKFCCGICDRKFTDKGDLNKHKKIHSGKKFQCYECGRDFIAKDYLRQHMKIHKRIKI